MKFKNTENSKNDTGISPVIGVILMVAITVVLAGVLGLVVFDIGQGLEQTPQVGLSYDTTEDGTPTVQIIHTQNTEKIIIQDGSGEQVLDGVGQTAELERPWTILGVTENGNKTVIHSVNALVTDESDGSSTIAYESSGLSVLADTEAEFSELNWSDFNTPTYNASGDQLLETDADWNYNSTLLTDDINTTGVDVLTLEPTGSFDSTGWYYTYAYKTGGNTDTSTWTQDGDYVATNDIPTTMVLDISSNNTVINMYGSAGTTVALDSLNLTGYELIPFSWSDTTIDTTTELENYSYDPKTTATYGTDTVEVTTSDGYHTKNIDLTTIDSLNLDVNTSTPTNEVSIYSKSSVLKNTVLESNGGHANEITNSYDYTLTPTNHDMKNNRISFDFRSPDGTSREITDYTVSGYTHTYDNWYTADTQTELEKGTTDSNTTITDGVVTINGNTDDVEEGYTSKDITIPSDADPDQDLMRVRIVGTDSSNYEGKSIDIGYHYETKSRTTHISGMVLEDGKYPNTPDRVSYMDLQGLTPGESLTVHISDRWTSDKIEFDRLEVEFVDRTKVTVDGNIPEEVTTTKYSG